MPRYISHEDLTFPQRRPLTKRPIILTTIFLLLLLLTISLSTLHPSSPLPSLSSLTPYTLTPNPLIPRRIITFSPSPTSQPSTAPDTPLALPALTWPARNPYHTHTRLTPNSTLPYVKHRYAHRPDLVATYEATTSPDLRRAMARYLALAADGGVWADEGTECLVSIDLWTRGGGGAGSSGDAADAADAGRDPGRVGMVVGVGYDGRDGEGEGEEGRGWPVEFATWTVGSRGGHAVMEGVRERVVGRVREGLEAVGREGGGEGEELVREVVGSKIFTEAVKEGIEKILGREVDWKEFSMLERPKIFGDVLVLPIDAFATGVAHSGARPEGNEMQLVRYEDRKQ
ncbi:hypothetical protein BDZ85DRAFT_281863 [Elsinoe ampelina]|uniref:Nucleotide-diphospho-sugar transferase n=1 Tax=Elsinoe ampelina TaxID=302913 RepID=A0A6A6GAR3_9PEZI|nr:hypothetical protein BDZ85DRAFT_281863 [Elsinoe ampelina]